MIVIYIRCCGVCGQGKFSYGQDYFPDRSCAPADCADCRMRRGFGRAAAIGSGTGLAGSPRSLGWTGCASRQIVWCNNEGSDVDRRQRLCVRSLSKHDRHSRRRRQGRPPERQSYAPGWRPSESSGQFRRFGERDRIGNGGYRRYSCVRTVPLEGNAASGMNASSVSTRLPRRASRPSNSHCTPVR